MKITIKVTEEDGGSLDCESIIIQNRINDIPTAMLKWAVPPSSESGLLQALEKGLLQKYTINVNDTDIFVGYNGGVPLTVTSSGIDLQLHLFGGMYKLSTLSCNVLGFHSFGSDDLSRSPQRYEDIKNTYMHEAAAIQSSNIVEVFKKLLDILFKYIKTIGAEGSGAYWNGLYALYTINSNLYQTVLDTELKKLVEIAGSEAVKFQEIKHTIIAHTFGMLAQNPQVTFWDLLVNLCEMYQLNIGSHNNKIYVFPNYPFGEPTITLQPNVVSSINISPIPMKIPTRCYFSTTGSIDKKKYGVPAIGGYPPITGTPELTLLEKRLNTIRIIRYEYPGVMLYRNSDEKETLIANDMAQSYLAKETFKTRTAQLTVRYNTNVPIGSIVKFIEPLFSNIYQGQVMGVVHSISSSSIQTELYLQHVASEKEMEFLGFKSLTNPVYPQYKSSNLDVILK